MNKQDTYKIETFDPHTAAYELWEKYFLLVEAVFKEEFPSYTIPKRELRIKQLQTKNPYRLNKRWALFNNNDELIGYAYVSYFTEASPEYETNKHVAIVNILVKKEDRQQGIGKILFDLLIKDANQMNRTALDFWTSLPSGKAACKRWGTKLLQEQYVNRLLMKDVDWDLMQRWIDESETKIPDVEFEYFTKIPDNDIHKFVDLYTETTNQAPWGPDTEVRVTVESRRYQEKDYDEKGFTWTTLCSREPNGEISGITEIIYKPEQPDYMQQELTGVRDKFRLRGLGKRLKAQMLFFIRDNYPKVEYLTTGNALANKAMLSINRRMGYKETNIFHLYRHELMQ